MFVTICFGREPRDRKDSFCAEGVSCREVSEDARSTLLSGSGVVSPLTLELSAIPLETLAGLAFSNRSRGAGVAFGWCS
jgi:hypothetical protein